MRHICIIIGTLIFLIQNLYSKPDNSQNEFYTRVFIDNTNSMSVESVKSILQRDLFFPGKCMTEPFNWKVTYWLYIQVPDSSYMERCVLSFHKWISLVEVYPYPYSKVSSYGGRMVPGRLKALNGSNVLLEPGVKSYLVKVQNRIYSASTAKNFEIVPFHIFEKRKEKNDFVHGLLLGSFVLMLIYNIVFFMFVKNKLHLYYVIYILLNTLFLLFTSNYSEVFLFPDKYRLNHVLLSGQIIGAFFYTMFLRKALQGHCQKYTSRIDRKIILPFAYIILAFNVAISVISFYRMDIYMVAQGLTNCTCSLAAYILFFYCYRSSDKFMHIIMLGSVTVFVFGYVNIIKLFFYLGSFSMYYETGLLIELLLFTYALNKLYFEEKFQMELEKHRLEKELEEKNRELVYKAIQLSAKDETISSIKQHIKKLTNAGKPLESILQGPEYYINTHLWQEFEKHFNETHPGFYKTLMEKFPDLSQNEIRLCAFLKLNLNTKEISMITKKSAHSIESMRSRIRQKMELQRDTNMTFVLSQM